MIVVGLMHGASIRSDIMGLIITIEKSMTSDKVLHSLFTFFMCWVWLAIIRSIIISLIVTIALMVIKELYDRDIKGTKFDWYDMLANGIGVILFIIIWFIV